MWRRGSVATSLPSFRLLSRNSRKPLNLLIKSIQAIRQPLECFWAFDHHGCEHRGGAGAQGRGGTRPVAEERGPRPLPRQGGRAADLRFFEPSCRCGCKARRASELELRQAISDGSLEAHYQPVIDLEAGRSPALRRCCDGATQARHDLAGGIHHGRGGDRSDHELGRWVLEYGLRRAANWSEEVRVAVNVSPVRCSSRALDLN